MSTVNASAPSLLRSLKPSALLRRLVNPRLLRLIGQSRVDRIDAFVNNNIMVKRRQRQCRTQPDVGDTADYLKTRFCGEPFRTLETTHTGLAFVCCPVWLPTPIGKLTDNPEEMWNGEVANDIRESILDGSFRYCNHLHCPSITNRALPSRDSAEAQKYISAFKAKARTLPTKVHLSHDKSCNLSCPSCRGDLYLANKTKQAELDKLTDRFVLPLLKNAESVMITGSGDPFGSNHFRNVIKKLTTPEFPDLRINLITNGLLCDPKAWIDLNLHGWVDHVHVSIDATTSETYKVVRRLGNFERLRKNLAFLKGRRETHDIRSLEFSMVVQSMNFRQMPAFVALAEEFSADAVHFQMIRQRDIFSAAEYEVAFIGDPRHPDYAEFIEVVNSPALRASSSPVRIEMGNVLAYVDRAMAPA